MQTNSRTLSNFNHKKRLLRAFAFATALCFFVTNHFGFLPVLQAAGPEVQFDSSLPQVVTEIQVPSEIGRIQDVFQGDSKQTVLIIQDAHAIAEAQRNIEKLILHFEKEYGVLDVALEGAEGKLDPQIFRSFPDQEQLRSVFEKLYDKGEVAGGGVASVFASKQANFFGAEDWELYQQGLPLYMKAMEEKESLLTQIQIRKQKLDAAKDQLYSAKLLEIDQLAEKYQVDAQVMGELLLKLAEIQKPEEGSALELILREASQDSEAKAKSEIDFEEVMGESQKIVTDFEAYLSKVKISLFRNDEERKLDQQSRSLYLEQKFTNLELTRKEWEEVKMRKVPGTFSRYLFYENAEAREKVMVETLTLPLSLRERARQSPSEGGVILITGGFHTQGITAQLQKKNISYITLLPRISSIPEDNHYHAHMRGDVSWKKHFELKNGKVNLYEAFVRGVRDELLSLTRPPQTLAGRPLPQGEGVILKLWRDQLIRDLVAQERIMDFKKYARFLDEAHLIANANQFIQDLHHLKDLGKFNPQNILKLLSPATYQAGATGSAPWIPTLSFKHVPGWAGLQLSSKSEGRITNFKSLLELEAIAKHPEHGKIINLKQALESLSEEKQPAFKAALAKLEKKESLSSPISIYLSEFEVGNKRYLSAHPFWVLIDPKGNITGYSILGLAKKSRSIKLDRIATARDGLKGRGAFIMDTLMNFAADLRDNEGYQHLDWRAEKDSHGFYHRYLADKVKYSVEDWVRFKVDLSSIGNLSIERKKLQEDFLAALIQREALVESTLEKLMPGTYNYVLPALSNHSGNERTDVITFEQSLARSADSVDAHNYRHIRNALNYYGVSSPDLRLESFSLDPLKESTSKSENRVENFKSLLELEAVAEHETFGKLIDLKTAFSNLTEERREDLRQEIASKPRFSTAAFIEELWKMGRNRDYMRFVLIDPEGQLRGYLAYRFNGFKDSIWLSMIVTERDGVKGRGTFLMDYFFDEAMRLFNSENVRFAKWLPMGEESAGFYRYYLSGKVPKIVVAGGVFIVNLANFKPKKSESQAKSENRVENFKSLLELEAVAEHPVFSQNSPWIKLVKELPFKNPYPVDAAFSLDSTDLIVQTSSQGQEEISVRVHPLQYPINSAAQSESRYMKGVGVAQEELQAVIERARKAGDDYFKEVDKGEEGTWEKILKGARQWLTIDHVREKTFELAGISSQLDSKAILELLENSNWVLVQDPKAQKSPLLVAKGWRKAAVAFIEPNEEDISQSTFYLSAGLIQNLIETNSQKGIENLLIYLVIKTLLLNEREDPGKTEFAARAFEGRHVSFAEPKYKTAQEYFGGDAITSESRASKLITKYFRSKYRGKARRFHLVIESLNDFEDPDHVSEEGITKLLDHPAATAVYEYTTMDPFLDHVGARHFDLESAEDEGLAATSIETDFVFVGGNCNICVRDRVDEFVSRLPDLSKKQSKIVRDLHVIKNAAYEKEKAVSMRDFMDAQAKYHLKIAESGFEDVHTDRKTDRTVVQYEHQEKGIMFNLIFWNDVEDFLTSLEEDQNEASKSESRTENVPPISAEEALHAFFIQPFEKELKDIEEFDLYLRRYIQKNISAQQTLLSDFIVYVQLPTNYRQVGIRPENVQFVTFKSESPWLFQAEKLQESQKSEARDGDEPNSEGFNEKTTRSEVRTLGVEAGESYVALQRGQLREEGRVVLAEHIARSELRAEYVAAFREAVVEKAREESVYDVAYVQKAVAAIDDAIQFAQTNFKKPGASVVVHAGERDKAVAQKKGAYHQKAISELRELVKSIYVQGPGGKYLLPFVNRAGLEGANASRVGSVEHVPLTEEGSVITFILGEWTQKFKGRKYRKPVMPIGINFEGYKEHEFSDYDAAFGVVMEYITALAVIDHLSPEEVRFLHQTYLAKLNGETLDSKTLKAIDALNKKMLKKIHAFQKNYGLVDLTQSGGVPEVFMAEVKAFIESYEAKQLTLAAA